MAVEVKARRPKEKIIPLRIVRFSREAFTAGIETRRAEGVEVRVYSPVETAADCFKCRNESGIDCDRRRV